MFIFRLKKAETIPQTIRSGQPENRSVVQPENRSAIQSKNRPAISYVSIFRHNHSLYHKYRFIIKILFYLLLAIFLNLSAIAIHRASLQQGIAEEVLRFHILANSDSEEDQNVKYQVRDAVLEWMSNELHDKPEAANTQGLQTKLSSVSQQDMTALPEQAILTDHEAILQFLSENLPQIEAVANTILNEQGMSYQAIAEITWSYFPDRTYGEYTFPAGWYQTLRIRLGTAKGQNWWCLLYPALCFSDCLHASFTEDGQTQLQETLTAEEYQTLLQNPSQWKITFRWADFLF